MTDKKLYRTREEVFGGVCGGIAKYFGLDPTLVQAAYAVLSICTAFSGVLAYIILMVIIPREPKQD